MNLSKRELEVAKLIAWGASDKEVAQELFISPETSHTYRKYILKKIGGHNIADLTRWYFQNEFKISFGLSPRLIKHIAMILLLITVYAEFSHLPVIRIRAASRAVASRQASAPARIRRRNELILAL